MVCFFFHCCCNLFIYIHRRPSVALAISVWCVSSRSPVSLCVCVCVSIRRTVRFRRSHWFQPQTMALGSEPLSFIGMVSDAHTLIYWFFLFFVCVYGDVYKNNFLPGFGCLCCACLIPTNAIWDHCIAHFKFPSHTAIHTRNFRQIQCRNAIKCAIVGLSFGRVKGVDMEFYIRPENC